MHGLFAIPKRIDSKNVNIPDLIIRNDKTKSVIIIEGKKSENIDAGIVELEDYDLIEERIINMNYPGYSVNRWVALFGNKPSRSYMDKINKYVIFQLINDGNIWINPKAPKEFQEMILKFKKAGF